MDQPLGSAIPTADDRHQFLADETPASINETAGPETTTLLRLDSEGPTGLVTAFGKHLASFDRKVSVDKSDTETIDFAVLREHLPHFLKTASIVPRERRYIVDIGRCFQQCSIGCGLHFLVLFFVGCLLPLQSNSNNETVSS